MTPEAWVAARSRSAPPALRDRVSDFVRQTPAADGLPATLGAASRRALDAVLAHPGDRAVALDLLAADALITMALLAQAEHHPAALSTFAAELLRASAPGA